MRLANNHVLDYRYSGLVETLDALHQAGLRLPAQAGRSRRRAGPPPSITTPTSRVRRLWLRTNVRILRVVAAAEDRGRNFLSIFPM